MRFAGAGAEATADKKSHTKLHLPAICMQMAHEIAYKIARVNRPYTTTGGFRQFFPWVLAIGALKLWGKIINHEFKQEMMMKEQMFSLFRENIKKRKLCQVRVDEVCNEADCSRRPLKQAERSVRRPRIPTKTGKLNTASNIHLSLDSVQIEKYIQ
jgi:hypothetical protein